METTNGESKIRKVIFNEFTLIIALVSVVSGIIFWISNPQNEMQIEIVKLQAQVDSNQTVSAALEKIKNNDFVEFHNRLKDIDDNQVDLMNAMAAMNARLNILCSN